ncbi:MAG TPA: hypothetical protein VHK28_02715 [Candidatus Limnocylindria bacterium]|nr:hypothetical protein [Candidatus Limnocylindria bacterium]
MSAIRTFSIVTWVLLPTVMFGGYSLLRLMNAEELSDFQLTFFRAGHAHAGVLLVMALVYFSFLARTSLSDSLKLWACVILMLGVLMQSGGFFLHMAVGEQGESSPGILVTTIGALLLTVAIGLLVYGLIITKSSPFGLPSEAAYGTSAVAAGDAPRGGSGPAPTAPV